MFKEKIRINGNRIEGAFTVPNHYEGKLLQYKKIYKDGSSDSGYSDIGKILSNGMCGFKGRSLDITNVKAIELKIFNGPSLGLASF